MAESPLSGWLKLYYAATPLFAVADFAFGANVRAAALAGHTGLRAGYYATCLGCAGLLSWKPAWSEAVGLVESSTNLVLLVLSVLAPYYALIEQLAAGNFPAASPITPGLVTNFLISGSVWTALFYSNRLGRSLGPNS